ncbi:MAG: thioesterase family protein [Marinobacter sp.]|nr:thioesterase family protein [Marinobacter sp.]
MFHCQIDPRFNDTDALGHISNTAYPVWFEQARTPVFELFHPSLDVKTWPIILARIEVDLKAQCYWGKPIDIETAVGKVGNSSCQVIQRAFQEGKEVAAGTAVLIYFDYRTEKPMPISDEIRARLAEHQSA